MIKIYKGIYKTTLFLVTFIIIFNSFAFAQTTVEKKYYGIIISPAVEFITLDPGESFHGSITLTNDFEERDPRNPDFIGDEVINYSPVSYLFEQNGETGDPRLLLQNSVPKSSDASEWLSFEETSYSMEYNESALVNYTVTAPKNAQPGGHYTTITFNEAATETENAENVSLAKAISALLFITVTGDANQDGELLEFKSSKILYEFSPIDFSIRYRNNGNLHDSVGGNIFIHRGDITKPTAILTVNEDSKITLPQSIRNYGNSLDYGFITNNEKIKIDTDKFPKLMIGKYTATLKLKHYSNNERITTEKEITFWVIPWRLILAILAIILLIIFISSKFTIQPQKKAKKRKLSKTMYN